MKSVSGSNHLLARALAFAFLSIALSTDCEVAARQQPNFVFMLSDNQAWNGLSIAMHPDLEWSKNAIIETPNLERIASQGMRFSAAYAPASVCSPTRISLQTGKSPAAWHWTKASASVTAFDGYKMIGPRISRQIAADEVTISELLQSAAYATARLGKWHLDGGGPAAHGYEVSAGDIGNECAHEFSDPNPADIFSIARRAAAFMEKSQQAGQPFFVQLSRHALNAPQNAMQQTLAQYASKTQRGVGGERISTAAFAVNLDTGVGMVLDAIDRFGLAGNTKVIYMSDNGSGGAKGGRPGLAGGKGGVWEGRIRCPMIVRGPGVPTDSWCHEPVVGYDLYPTFCELAGIAESWLPAGIEGGSLVDLFKKGQGSIQRPREELIFHFPHYQGADGSHSALFLGQFKLMKFYDDERVSLYDLSSDVGERNDLSTQLHERAT
ncbi:sulfatase-like hydrolase/transferase [Rhodopirellula sp. SWK7]|uniref:sulfatase-like hydrolase/transferase n=1 Tax=Rhodopirellula sp. SWK7 TaxID=595460 RepID=UPI0002C021CA|nr:sulfatase-like hydrolase/transferase [Rhodopirellula sp. SWK7]EMI42439.1 arylsulfatase [Rhodopirellula sp. SWK7]